MSAPSEEDPPVADRRTTRGTRQHFQPANFLGRFSDRQTGKMRERRLWAYDIRAGRAFCTTGGKLARVDGLYDVSDERLGPAGTADIAWGFEASLPQALDALAGGLPLAGEVWAKVLVPWFASLFARGPDFEKEFNARFPDGLRPTLADVLTTDNATAARLIFLQELLAPVMSCRWTVMHFLSGAPLITSDTAYTAATLPSGVVGYVVPIGPSTAVAVEPSRSTPALRWDGQRWIAVIDHLHTSGSAEAEGCSRAMAAFARTFVVGPTKQSVESNAAIAVAPSLGAGLLETIGKVDLPCHGYDYFRVLSAMRHPPQHAQSAADDVDWSAVDPKSWTGPIAVEVGHPERTRGGVRVTDDEIVVELEYGRAVRSVRRQLGDFTMGARALLELELVRKNQGRIACNSSPEMMAPMPSLT